MRTQNGDNPAIKRVAKQKAVTKMAVEAQSATELELARKEAEAAVANQARSGKGTRVRVGQTRGRSSQVISWEAFDETQPETLPTTFGEFQNITGIKDESKIVDFLISGFNDASYTEASDPIKEFVNPAWPDEVKTAFRLVVRNMHKTMAVLGSSLEDVVNQVKPGFEAAAAKK